MALTDKELRNRERVLGLYRDVLDPHDRTRLPEYLVADYIQHSPEAASGIAGVGDFLDWLKATYPLHRNHIKRVFAQDDHVVVHLHCYVGPGEPDMAVVDMFRLNDAGMIVEHWDVVQRVPEVARNDNGMF